MVSYSQIHNFSFTSSSPFISSSHNVLHLLVFTLFIQVQFPSLASLSLFPLSFYFVLSSHSSTASIPIFFLAFPTLSFSPLHYYPFHSHYSTHAFPFYPLIYDYCSPSLPSLHASLQNFQSSIGQFPIQGFLHPLPLTILFSLCSPTSRPRFPLLPPPSHIQHQHTSIHLQFSPSPSCPPAHFYQSSSPFPTLAGFKYPTLIIPFPFLASLTSRFLPYACLLESLSPHCSHLTSSSDLSTRLIYSSTHPPESSTSLFSLTHLLPSFSSFLPKHSPFSKSLLQHLVHLSLTHHTKSIIF